MLFDTIKRAIHTTIFNNKNLSANEKQEISSKLEELQNQEVNFLIVGGTGVGKSSTVNSLFKDSNLAIETEAKVGLGPNPETQNITPYKMGNIIFWDTPGVGESKIADINHLRAINKKLREQSSDGSSLIDFVLIILDGGSKDLNSLFDLLGVITPALGTNNSNRILIAINKIDNIKNGRGWDIQNNRPTEKLEKHISQTVSSIKQRIKENAKLDIDPIPYCAGYEDEFGIRPPYNIADLLCAMLNAVVPKKRIVILQQTKETVVHNATREQKVKIEKHASSALGSTLLRVGLGVLTGGLLGGCFITTAICHSLHKKDNCFLLYEFRKFRDHWLAKQSDGPKLIKEYYEKAPAIVANINSLNDKERIYKSLYTKYLKPCHILLKHREYRQCKKLYTKMIQQLYKLYLKN